MVFVTLDQKQDWWTHAAGAPLYPRFELYEEFSAATGGQTVRLLRFSEFLSNFGAEGAVIKEVQRVEHEVDAVPNDGQKHVLDDAFEAKPTGTSTYSLRTELDALSKMYRGLVDEQNRAYKKYDQYVKDDNLADVTAESLYNHINSLEIRREGLMSRIRLLNKRLHSIGVSDAEDLT
jgi:hypothetical protein